MAVARVGHGSKCNGRSLTSFEKLAKRYLRRFTGRWDFASIDAILQEFAILYLKSGEKCPPEGSQLDRKVRGRMQHAASIVVRQRKHLNVGRSKEIAREDSVPSPLEQLLRTERHEQVRKAISLLTPFEQALVIDHYFKGIRICDLAASFGKDSNFIAGKLFRARKKLAIILGKDLICT